MVYKNESIWLQTIEPDFTSPETISLNAESALGRSTNATLLSLNN